MVICGYCYIFGFILSILFWIYYIVLMVVVFIMLIVSVIDVVVRFEVFSRNFFCVSGRLKIII